MKNTVDMANAVGNNVVALSGSGVRNGTGDITRLEAPTPPVFRVPDKAQETGASFLASPVPPHQILQTARVRPAGTKQSGGSVCEFTTADLTTGNRCAWSVRAAAQPSFTAARTLRGKAQQEGTISASGLMWLRDDKLAEYFREASMVPNGRKVREGKAERYAQ